MVKRLSYITLFFAVLASLARAEEGFEPIFDGRSFKGWDAVEGAWEVKDGAFRSTGRHKQKNWLIWRGGEPGNFILRLKFRFHKGNSGVQVRSRDLGGNRVQGYQVEVAQKKLMGLWHHSLAPEAARRTLATAGQKVVIASDGEKTVEVFAKPEDVQSFYDEDAWNDLEIIANGLKLVQKINGVVFSELTDLEEKHVRLSGSIALQDHGQGTLVEYKDIRLKRVRF